MNEDLLSLQEKLAYAERDRDAALEQLARVKAEAKEKSKRTGEICSRLVGENKLLNDTLRQLVKQTRGYLSAVDYFMETGKTAPGWSKDQYDALCAFLKTLEVE